MELWIPAMGYFRRKIEFYWAQSCLQRPDMARHALELYQSRVKLKAAKVLEVGCGSGFFSIELAKAGAWVVALDIDPDRIEGARKRAVERDACLSLVTGDAQRSGFKDETFDLILCRNVIEHVDYPRRMFEEVARILKPGGAIQLTAPNRYSLSQLISDEHYRLPLVVILPRKLASFIVCKIFSLEDNYSVGVIPSYRMLMSLIRAQGFTTRMDLPDRNLIKEKLICPERINNGLVRRIVKASQLVGLNGLFARIASAEGFLGLFAAGWSLWITTPNV